VDVVIGCTGYGEFCLNLLAYADDISILAPSWQGLQMLLAIIDKDAKALLSYRSIRRRLCTLLNPCDKHKVVCNSFPQFQRIFYHLYHSSVILATSLRTLSVTIATSIERENVCLRELIY